MTDTHDGSRHPGLPPADDDPVGNERRANTISPLPGEPGIPDVAVARPGTMSVKGLLAVGLLLVGMVAVTSVSISHFVASGKKADGGAAKRLGDRPAAAAGESRKLDFLTTVTATASAASSTSPRIPALVPTAEERAEVEPIGVHRTGQGPGSPPPVIASSPEDAPVLLVSSRPSGVANRAGSVAGADANGDAAMAPSTAEDPLVATTRSLQGYQQQLQGMLDTLNSRTTASPSRELQAAGNRTIGTLTPPQASPIHVTASLLADRSLTLPQGTAFTCALTTRVISATSGPVSCLVQRDVYGDDGRVLLIERGSHLDGDYRIASVKPGTIRIPVVWSRLRTPQGVIVDIDSPGTGPLGEGGVEGDVDNRWGERIGAALLLSLIDDSVQLVIQDQANGNGTGSSTSTVVLPSTTANTSKLAEKVLDSTINIPPLIYQNQGGIVGIVVAHDVDFSSVYELRPTAITLPSADRGDPSLASAPASTASPATR